MGDRINMDDLIKEISVYKVDCNGVRKIGCTPEGVSCHEIFEPLDYARVIFNYPATIVLWKDGTKTVVKCGKNDIYDREKGLALCFMKKALNNSSGKMNRILHKEVPSWNG